MSQADTKQRIELKKLNLLIQNRNLMYQALTKDKKLYLPDINQCHSITTKYLLDVIEDKVFKIENSKVTNCPYQPRASIRILLTIL